MATAARLKTLLPHMQHPVVAAPMAMVSGADLAVAVSQARGLGFLAGGYDLPKLESELHRARALIAPALSTNNPRAADEDRPAPLPVGVGLFAWTSPDQARVVLRTVLAHRPCALWLFAPATPGVEGFRFWVDAINTESSAASSPHDRPAIFAQVASVREALEAVEAGVDIIVAQGADAGGHGAKVAAGLTSLVPEVRDALPPDVPLFAAGGVMDGRGLASVLALGADGAALGTRFLASREATVHPAYQRLIVEARDGGQSTLRTRLFDELRGTTDWPQAYDGRALRNESVRGWESGGGASMEDLKAAYARATADRDYGRLVAWAGTGVGLAREVKPAKDIVEDIVRECAQVVQRLHERCTDSTTT